MFFRSMSMDNAIVSTTEAEAREAVFAELSASWGHEVPVSLNDYGSIYLRMVDTPVLCRFSSMALGHVVVEVESPCLLDFLPPPDFYELISLLQFKLGFGSILVAAGQEDGQAIVVVSAKLFADGLTGTHLKRAILLIHRTALDQIQLLENLSPPLGGHREYG